MTNKLDPNILTDEEVIHYAYSSDDPWVTRLVKIIEHLETDLAFTKEENEALMTKAIHGDY